ncbi:MAM and LDL-receptor class A domain-containing protein 2-like [Patiria miniata]|uniref:Uncharacterized protein n=1 Tax=Patiria miniata TaxID=46514 RepID=A0A913Z0C8_PATMI|nr:MAM and LDL-receptor class A domain-containing protein 2-like [Patiria miniata]
MEKTRQISAGIVLILVLNAAVAANEMSRLFEDMLPYYCEDSEEASCREALRDPGTLLTNVLRRQAGLEALKSSESILQQSLQEGLSLVEVECNFDFASFPIPVPFLCDWTTESNDDINWEPGSVALNVVTKEPGPFSLTVYAISRLNSETSTATAGMLTPMINCSTDGNVYGALQFEYNLRGTEDDNKLKVKYVGKDGVRITIWSSEDDFKSNSWETANVYEFYPSGPFQLAFESTLSPGSETKPYAAVDNVGLQVGVLPSIFDCEGGTPHSVTCGLIDLEGRWQRWSGSEALDKGRGPTTDHTLGTSSGHFTINVKPSLFTPGTTARMQTPEFHRWTNETTCTFRFYYHAKTSGDMEVTVSADYGTEVFPVALNYSETWEEHDIDLTKVSGKYRVTIQVSTSTGNGNHIAIDDVQFLEEDCRGRLFCSSFPCLNNGACWQTLETDYGCNCTKEYEGSDCGINVDECSRDPTLCASDSNRICKDASPGYQCVCKPGTIEYKGKCIAACTDTMCTRKNEVCLQNDNAFSCQCQYGYVESNGECIRDKSEVESGIVPYTFNVLLGTYLGGSLVAVVVAALVVLCYFSCCDEKDDDWKQEAVEANHYNDADVAGGSGLNANGTGQRSPAANGGVELKNRGPEKM